MRAIETPEMLGCIVLTEGARQELTSQQMEVVAIGAPSICDDELCDRFHRYNTNRGGDNFGRGPVWRDPRARAQGASCLLDAGPTTGERPWTIYYHPVLIQVGDWVLLAPRSLTETDVAGISCVHQDDVLAVLTEKAPV